MATNLTLRLLAYPIGLYAIDRLLKRSSWPDGWLLRARIGVAFLCLALGEWANLANKTIPMPYLVGQL